MDQLVFLGIASNSFETLNTSSFAVRLDNDRWILVDCGPDIPRQLIKSGIPFLDIHYVIVTHRHLDHCLSVPYFIFGRYIESQVRTRKTPNFVPSDLHIIAELDVWEALQKLLRFAYPDIKSLGFKVKHLDIGSFLHRPQEVANVTLQTFVMLHTVPAYGFIMWEKDQKKLAYSTDTLPCATFLQAASGVDILIHEAMVPASESAFSTSTKHSTALQAGEAISSVRPKKAFVIHVRPSFWGLRDALEKQASDAAGMRVQYPNEGQVVNLD